MTKGQAQKLARLASILERVPGALDSVSAYAERMHAAVERGRRAYKTTHWGRPGNRGAFASTVPDVSGDVVVLGALQAVAYTTTKGRDGTSTYVHDFNAPYPVLCFAPEGTRKGLVIVRGDSRYNVETRGIVG